MENSDLALRRVPRLSTFRHTTANIARGKAGTCGCKLRQGVWTTVQAHPRELLAGMREGPSGNSRESWGRRDDGDSPLTSPLPQPQPVSGSSSLFY